MIEMDMPKIDVTENEERSYAKIVVEPLEKGFGLTIGNCLRRILLSALPAPPHRGSSSWTEASSTNFPPSPE